MTKYILGINAFHGDSSACLLRDGEMIAAVEEERFRRIKHWAGFPSESIHFCLTQGGIKLGDVSHIAINQNAFANLWHKMIFIICKRPNLGVLFKRIKNKRQRINLRDHLSKAFPDEEFSGQIHQVEHHLAHMGSAFYVSPFEKASVLSIDGFGDFASTCWGIGNGAAIKVEGSVKFPHSLGIFYQALTQFIGFPNYGDEYKVMGLAPYGKPLYLNEMRQIVHLNTNGSFRLNLNYFRHHSEKVEYEWENKSPSIGQLFSKSLEDLLGTPRAKDDPLTQRHKDIANSVQAMYEEGLFNLLNKLYVRHGLDAIVIAGGCAMNSVANGKILLRTPFKRLYVQSAAGDAGGAIGAAMVLWHRINNSKASARVSAHDHAYWGPSYNDAEVELVLNANQDTLRIEGCSVEKSIDSSCLYKKIASEIADGKVVGWFQGRMEWGPRALGNRSIICDPRRANMKDILNAKIKRRESFRPFAPSVLRESVNEWFEQDDDVPFMMQVYQIRQEKRSLIPAVTHLDGSGRLQTVYLHTNAPYYKLISAFRDLTGVPMVLNTSFNENEPIVCKPEEALDCFMRTKMDTLVIGSWVVSRGC